MVTTDYERPFSSAKATPDVDKRFPVETRGGATRPCFLASFPLTLVFAPGWRGGIIVSSW